MSPGLFVADYSQNDHPDIYLRHGSAGAETNLYPSVFERGNSKAHWQKCLDDLNVGLSVR